MSPRKIGLTAGEEGDIDLIQALLDAMQLARADFTGMLSAVSPAWAKVLGWSEAELLSRSERLSPCRASSGRKGGGTKPELSSLGMGFRPASACGACSS